jgi:hypothetical protein
MAENGKLTYDQACEIRRRHAAGESQEALRLAYGVSQPSISAIVLMKTHKRRPPTAEQRRENELLQKRRSWLKKRYGLTIEQVDAMELASGNRCQICGCAPEDQSPHWRTGTHKLYIDHCHATGKVRGLLCRNCNTAVGLMKDDPELMMKMIEYVKKNAEKC